MSICKMIFHPGCATNLWVNISLRASFPDWIGGTDNDKHM